MSHYRGPRLRICRRLGKLPGLTNKISKKSNPPGDHGSSLTKKPSQFSIRLKEKQKLRFNYRQKSFQKRFLFIHQHCRPGHWHHMQHPHLTLGER